jgi:hypothetical protein
VICSDHVSFTFSLQETRTCRRRQAGALQRHFGRRPGGMGQAPAGRLVAYPQNLTRQSQGESATVLSDSVVQIGRESPCPDGKGRFHPFLGSENQATQSAVGNAQSLKPVPYRDLRCPMPRLSNGGSSLDLLVAAQFGGRYALVRSCWHRRHYPAVPALVAN